MFNYDVFENEKRESLTKAFLFFFRVFIKYFYERKNYLMEVFEMNVIRWLYGSDLDSLIFRYISVPYKFCRMKRYDKTKRSLFYEDIIDDYEYVCFCIEDIMFWRQLSRIKKRTAVSLRLYYMEKLLEYEEYLFKDKQLSYSECEVYKRLIETPGLDYWTYEFLKRQN